MLPWISISVYAPLEVKSGTKTLVQIAQAVYDPESKHDKRWG